MSKASSSLSRLTFQLRLVLALGALSLLVAAIAGLAIWGVAGLRTSAQQASNDNQLSQLASNVVIEALLCRTYEKDFFLNAGNVDAQDEPLQQWHEVSLDLRRAIKDFEAAATTDSDRKQAQMWRDSWGIYIKDFGRAEIAINVGEIKTPQDALSSFEPYQDNIRTITEQAVAVAKSKAESAQASSQNADAVGSNTTWQVALTAALVFIASVAWSLVFPAWLTRPIKVLQRAATRLSAGDLSARVGLQRQDELGALAQSFDRMAQIIQYNTNDLEAQYASASAARAAAEAARCEIAEQLATIEQQRAMISEMSVPILPLNDQTLVMPLVGALDSTRITQVQTRALHSIEKSAAHYLILDITGVPVVDTQVAAGLMQVVQAARILGCEVMLVGIRPEVAQAVVGLGIDLGRITTRSTLQDGVSSLLRRIYRQEMA
jgi:rsbT co-antagonist protein RsbR